MARAGFDNLLQLLAHSENCPVLCPLLIRVQGRRDPGQLQWYCSLACVSTAAMLGELDPPESPIGRCLGFQFMNHELNVWWELGMGFLHAGQYGIG